MLHLTNGESTAFLAREAEVPGDVRSVDDILMEGPLVGGLATPSDWILRARWLEANMGIPRGDYLVRHARREKAIRHAADHDEIVVWTEADLFCQTNATHLLHRLREENLGARVSLVHPGGNARLGRASIDEIARLFEARTRASEALLDTASRAWRALSSPDPRDVEHLARMGSDAWPSLAAGLRDHLARFPSTRNGLAPMQETLLRALAGGARNTDALVQTFLAAPAIDALGATDAQAHARLREMAQEPRPLVYVDDPRSLEDANLHGAWSLTDDGRRVLAGDADAIELRGIDAWLGGVHLTPETLWRWDEDKRTLRPA